MTDKIVFSKFTADKAKSVMDELAALRAENERLKTETTEAFDMMEGFFNEANNKRLVVEGEHNEALARIKALESVLRGVLKESFARDDLKLLITFLGGVQPSAEAMKAQADRLWKAQLIASQALAANGSEPLETYIDTDLPMPPKTVREVEGKIVSDGEPREAQDNEQD